MLLRRKSHTNNDDARADSCRTSFYRIDDPSTLTALLRTPCATLIAIHSRAFPLFQPDTKSNGHQNGQYAPVLQDVQETYRGMYNKRYLVEVAMGDGDIRVPGAVRL